MLNTNVNVGTNRAPSRVQLPLSRCCGEKAVVWTHWVETRAGDEVRRNTTIVCSACRGPADGSRPEDDDRGLPWGKIAREPAGDVDVIFRRRSVE